MEEISEGNDFEDGSSSLPPKPIEPLPSDCCGSGCRPCVFDIYEQELKDWQKRCQELKNLQLSSRRKSGAESATTRNSVVLSQIKFEKFLLEEIISVNRDASFYKFKLPENQSLGFNVGQHLVLRCEHNGKLITRSYTPVSCPKTEGHFDMIIKVYQNGLMSQCIKQWTVGDYIEWRGPFGDFVYQKNQYEYISMLAAGTGIAPMVQIIRTVLDDENDETILLLLYTCKKTTDILMKDQLDEYKHYWNFNVTYCITQMDSTTIKQNMKYGDTIIESRIDENILSKTLPAADLNSQVLICGTKSFDKDMINYVKGIGYKDENIFKF